MPELLKNKSEIECWDMSKIEKFFQFLQYQDSDARKLIDFASNGKLASSKKL